MREPDDDYDPIAVPVFADGVKIGYVPKVMARRVAQQLDADVELAAIFIAGAQSSVAARHVRVVIATPDALASIRCAPSQRSPRTPVASLAALRPQPRAHDVRDSRPITSASRTVTGTAEGHAQHPSRAPRTSRFAAEGIRTIRVARVHG
ncbi:HIRAN domain-containing protein [Pseudoclavibacter sp. AY1H1]|uniref:HIRAN domain-containing protein n=1 Tax=Pseudoclavibacter sp. AY1H1 TaxID=2080584 RepID=UPI0035BE9F44